MTQTNQFYCRVYKNGIVKVDVSILNNKHSMLRSILLNFSNIKELQRIKKEIIDELKKNERTGTGQNTLNIKVNENVIELSHTYDKNTFQRIPLNIVMDFIEDCIEFHKLFNSGGIPRIIPDSKKGDWVICPKEYIKKEYWEALNIT